MQLPQDYHKRLDKLYGSMEREELLNALQESPVTGLRINPLKMTGRQLEEYFGDLITPVPWTSLGYYYGPSLQPGKHPFHHAGLYYIQEPSAMAVAELVDPQPGEKVLDLCAAPGGKSTHLASIMSNQGVLVSNEYNAKRAKALVENVERFGLRNVLITNETAERLAQHFPAYFDRILIDAPCSGEGMFRKDEEAITTWSEDKIRQLVPIQADLLRQAYTMLRPGGILVYSTCTFAPEENERQIEAFLQGYSQMKLLQLQHVHGMEGGRTAWTESGWSEIEKTLHLWPHRLRGEGHFVAKMQKIEDEEARFECSKKKVGKQNVEQFRRFYQEVFHHPWSENAGDYFQLKEHLYWLPKEMPNFSGLHVLRAGLYLGQQKEKYFQPAHALALASSTSEGGHCLHYPQDALELRQYLRGETLAGEGNRGWILITVDGYPIGWGKESQQQVKNHYPKGLRTMGL